MNGSLSQTGDFRFPINSSVTVGTVQTVFDMSIFTSKFSKYTNCEIGFKSVLESFSATVNLSKSLITAQIPNIAPEDTWAERLSKQMDLEQRFPSVTLSLWLDNGDGQGWGTTAKANLSLHNYGGEYYQPLLYPYLSQGAVRLLSSGEKLGVSVSPALSSNDYILIEGGWSCTVGMVQI